MWCVSAWTRFVDATGVDAIVVHEAANLPGYPAGTSIVGLGELVDAVVEPTPPASPVIPTMTTTDGAGVPGEPGHIPAVDCDGCGCDVAWGKTLTFFDYVRALRCFVACVPCFCFFLGGGVVE